MIIWQSNDSSDEQIDIIENAEDYNMLNTDNCTASYIKGTLVEKILGDKFLIEKVLRTKTLAQLCNSPEQKDVKVEGGKFVMVISKENPDLGIYYQVVMENGKKVSEYYQAEGTIINLHEISYTTYSSSKRPINYEEYEDMVKEFAYADSVRKTVKTEQAEFIPYDELMRKYPQLSHILKNDYVVVESYEQAVERFEQWVNSPEQLKSFDIESFSTDWGPYSTNRITGVFLGYGTEWSTYFPFRQQNFQYNLPIEFLRKIFDAINNQPAYPEVIILAHNSKFEKQGFYQEFRELVRCDVDTYILAVLVDPLIKKGSHTLKNLTAKVDHNFYISLEQIFIGPVKFNVLTPDIVKIYGCPDATSPAKLYKYLMSKLPRDEFYVKRLEMSIIDVKAMQEFYGIRMDMERLENLVDDETYNCEKLSDIFKKAHHTSRNINSNDVLSEILYHKLRCRVEVRTNKGAPATSKTAIDRIVQTGAKKIDENTPIPKDIMGKGRDKNTGEGKEVSLVKGKDLASNKYPSLVVYQNYKKRLKELGALNRLKNKSVGGFFKFYINQVGAGSNRQTSDAHQFSDTMKSCALADSPYHQLVSSDWAQVELRILAGLAKQEDLIELESDPGVDIHRAILSIIQKLPMYMISEEMRKAGKSVNFGVVYGMSEYGLALRDFGPSYTKENLNEERKKITDFFNGLPMVKMFIKTNEDNMKKNGYVKTAFNYYRYFPELLDPTCDPKLVKRMLRAGGNTPIQGTGAQMLKIVEKNIWEYIRKKGWDKEVDYDGVMLPIARMILPIHDEILFSYDKTRITMEEVCAMFKECMQLDIDGMPPFFAAPAFINNWLDGKDPAFEVDVPFRDKVVEEWKKGNLLLTGHDYLKTLNDYRNEEIREYMAGLISTYRTAEEVAKHVTDDSLTHTLIEMMLPKDERKKLTHVERIYEATKRYMDKLEADGELATVTYVMETDTVDKSQFMEYDEWASTYTYIDSNGDLIREENETDEYENDTEEVDIEELLPIEERTADECTSLFLMNECLIDITSIGINNTSEDIYKAISQLHQPDGYYTVIFVMGNKTIKTPIRIGYIPDEVDAIFNEVKSRERMMV